MKSWVEISGTRLAENFRAVRFTAGQEVETLAVIKADAYGHDAPLCASVLTQAGARWLGVTDVDEGAAVRAAVGEADVRILVMSGMEARDAPAIVENYLVPVVWTLEQVAAMEQAARSAGRRVAVHVEVDTGMSRQGAATGEPLRRVLAGLADSQWVFCEGVMTHLCCTEVAGAATTALAQERFGEALTDVAAAGLKPAFVHLGNSSAVDEGSTMRWVKQEAEKLGARAMVRTGLALYGYCLPIEASEAPNGHLRPGLKPVLTWKTRVLDLREVEAGATVGYGASFIAERKMTLALLPVGYADGFRREASSGIGDGWVMICGKRARVVGRVSMNLTVVDISAIDGAAVGGEVVLLGEGVSAENHAVWAGTISYEILCEIRGKRVLL